MYYVVRKRLRYLIPEVVALFANSGKYSNPQVIPRQDEVTVYTGTSKFKLCTIEHGMSLAITEDYDKEVNSLIECLDLVPVIPRKKDSSKIPFDDDDIRF